MEKDYSNPISEDLKKIVGTIVWYPVESQVSPLKWEISGWSSGVVDDIHRDRCNGRPVVTVRTTDGWTEVFLRDTKRADPTASSESDP